MTHLTHLTFFFNNITTEENIHDSWKTSSTILIQKKNKLSMAGLRPITLTNTSYKILIGIFCQKLENNINDLQSGFTEDRRITDNMYILKYCIYITYKTKKELVVTLLV